MIARLMLAALLLGAAPVMAETAAPPMPAQGDTSARMIAMGRHMFGSMSPEGRRTMTDAMRAAAPADMRAGHDAVRAARDRMLAVLAADQLDIGALKRAMDDEREAATAIKSRHQAAMLAAFQRLSAADRKAFVADARSMRQRVEHRGHGIAPM